MVLCVLGLALTTQCVNAQRLNPAIAHQQNRYADMSQLNSPQVSPPVRYQDLYSMLDAKLDSVLSYVNSQWAGTIRNVCYSAELITANGHRGEELLKPESIQAVALTLDRLKSLGIRGVKVAAKYPLLRPDFPNSRGYLDFYRRVGQEVKTRNLVLYVATTTAFRDPSFTSLRVDYTGLTFQQFKKELRQYAETVVENIRPDYLTIINEPETQEMNTGLDFSVQNVKELVEYVQDGLDRRGTLIGAGAGTWDKIDYFQSLAQIPGLDYLDIHIYPINHDFLVDKAIRIAKIAKDHGKKLVLSEAWLYKVRDRELGTATAASAELFARDVFSFWSPLDQKFLEAIVKLANLLKIDLCSFFWMQYFYSYLEYDEQRSALKPAQLFATVNAKAAKNILSNTLTPTGMKLKNLISSFTTTSSQMTEDTRTAQKIETAVRESRALMIGAIAISAVLAATIIYLLRKRADRRLTSSKSAMA